MIKHQLLPAAAPFASGAFDLKEHLKQPLDVGYCTVFICNSGSATITYNFIKYHLKAGSIFIMFGDVSVIPFEVTSDFSVFGLAISEQMAAAMPYKDYHDLFDFLHYNPLFIPTAEQRKLLINWQQMIEWMDKSADASIENRLLLTATNGFFLALESEVKKKNTLTRRSAEDRRYSTTANRLLKLILEHVRENKDLSFYAAKLNVTTGYLYKVMQKEFQTTPKAMIDCFVVSELKALLTTSNLSIKEIANEMNFEDPSYLNRFFNRHTGISLTRFRSEIHGK